ncbi:MAG: hypothetical protein ABI743_02070 [bacterium]
MTPPINPAPTAWAFGFYDQRISGTGLPGMILSDSVLPYSTPSPMPDDFTLHTSPWPATWWPNTTDPIPVPVDGQFQGYERNMDKFGVGAPNFPDGYGFGIVVITTGALQLSGTAPTRRDRALGDEITADLTGWPKTLVQGARLMYDLYFDRYLSPLPTPAPDPPALPGWYAICTLPEREIRDLLEFGAMDDELKGLVQHLPQWWGYRIIGWYGVDEPELGDNTDSAVVDRQAYSSPAQAIILRDKIRSWEHEWRNTPGNDARYFGAGAAEQALLLRPVITSFSAYSVAAVTPPPVRPLAYRDAFDIFMFDQYPYTQKLWQLRDDVYLTGTPPSATPHQYTLTPAAQSDLTIPLTLDRATQKVLQSLQNFTKFATAMSIGVNSARIPTDDTKLLNPPFTAGWRPIANWVQANGWPFRQPYQYKTFAEWTLEPADPPKLYEGGDGLTQVYVPPVTGSPTLPASLLRPRRRPSLLDWGDELRFYAWASLFRGSEGFPCFSQTGVSASEILNDYVPLANEILYFRNFRQSLADPANNLTKYVHTSKAMPGVKIYLFNYPNPDSPGTANEKWLFMLDENDPGPNFNSGAFGFDIWFDGPIPGLGTRFQLYRFGAPVLYESFPVNIHFRYHIEPGIFRLWKLVP